jgi:hypothetical protein
MVDSEELLGGFWVHHIIKETARPILTLVVSAEDSFKEGENLYDSSGTNRKNPAIGNHQLRGMMAQALEMETTIPTSSQPTRFAGSTKTKAATTSTTEARNASAVSSLSFFFL